MKNEETDRELIFRALNYWANHIETGKISMSANDAYNYERGELCKRLDYNQMVLVERLRNLADDALANKPI